MADGIGNPTTPATLANAIAQNVIDRRILDFARQATFLPRLVWDENTSDENSLAHFFPQYGGLAAANTTQGTDISATEVDVNAGATVTCAEIAILIEPTRLALSATAGRVDPDSLARQMSFAVAETLETNIAALFPSFNAGVGTSGQPMALIDFDNALYTLRAAHAPVGNPSNNNAPRQGYAMVLSERALTYFLMDLRAANLSTFVANPEAAKILIGAGDMSAENARGVYEGIPVFGSTLLASANAGVDDVSAMFCPTAIGMVRRSNDNTGNPFRMELPRPRGRSDEMALVLWVGVGVIVNGYGVKIVNSAT